MKILASLLLAAATVGTGGDGYLVSPPLGGFAIGYQVGNERGGITEEVPQGESVERWTRMVTTQRFTGVAARVSAADYAQTFVQSLPQGCPGAKLGAIANLRVSGRSAARLRADCPRNPETGLPETFFLLAIAGPQDMHVKQVAFRRKPSAADTAFAENFLAGVSWCAVGSKEPPCGI